MANPFVALFERPVATLTAAAYALVLMTAMLATWYAGSRNLLYLVDRWQDGWRLLVPFWYAVRVAGLLLVVAIDCLLIAGIIAVIV